MKNFFKNYGYELAIAVLMGIGIASALGAFMVDNDITRLYLLTMIIVSTSWMSNLSMQHQIDHIKSNQQVLMDNELMLLKMVEEQKGK